MTKPDRFSILDAEGPTARVLLVMETILLNGPVTLGGLCDLLPISRAAIWRALNTLRARGWVRMRMGDNAFEASHHFGTLSQAAHKSYHGAEEANALLQRLSRLGPFHVEIGALTALGRFTILETSSTAGYGQPERSLTDDRIAIAAQIGIGPTDQIRHLTQFMAICGDDERHQIQSGRHAQLLKKLKSKGIVWDSDSVAFALPYRIVDLPAAAIQIELKSVTQENQRLLESVASELAQSAVHQPYTN
jgi:DNA-binding MarR family transcriptional regulator